MTVVHPPTTEQQAILDAFPDGGNMVIVAAAGSGKTTSLKMIANAAPQRKGLYLAYNRALRNDQPVLTPEGWKPIGDMQVGAQAIGADGRPHTVTKVHPLGVRPMYELAFSDGTVVVADEDHLWVTQTITYDAKERAGKRWVVRTTRQIAETVHQIHRVPQISAPAELESSGERPISPYLLGALLGDGSFRHRAVLFACTEPALVELLRAELPPGHEINQLQDGGRGRAWSITGAPGRGRNAVLNALRALGLHGHGSATKFIPSAYLYAPVADRLALLQGLMDTDGCAQGQQSFFITTSKQLTEDVAFLAQSLGGVVSVRSVPAGMDRSAGELV